MASRPAEAAEPLVKPLVYAASGMQIPATRPRRLSRSWIRVQFSDSKQPLVGKPAGKVG